MADAWGVGGSGGFALSAIALVTEKGDLCDHTHPADARRTRTPQLYRINDPQLSAYHRGSSPLCSETAGSFGPGDIRRYQVYLREERKSKRVDQQLCALRTLAVEIG